MKRTPMLSVPMWLGALTHLRYLLWDPALPADSECEWEQGIQPADFISGWLGWGCAALYCARSRPKRYCPAALAPATLAPAVLLLLSCRISLPNAPRHAHLPPCLQSRCQRGWAR